MKFLIAGLGSIGRRHFPINQVFQNGPIQGHDVFIPLDSIIGGQKMAGKGWTSPLSFFDISL